MKEMGQGIALDVYEHSWEGDFPQQTTTTIEGKWNTQSQREATQSPTSQNTHSRTKKLGHHSLDSPILVAVGHSSFPSPTGTPQVKRTTGPEWEEYPERCIPQGMNTKCGSSSY